MRIKFEIENTNVEFICETVDTRSGFAHVAEMYIGNDMYPYGKGRVNYYNRTWECWRYQTVCRRIVAEMLEGIEARLKSDLKIENGWSRMTAERNKVLEEVVLGDSDYKFYLQLYRELSNR